MSHWQGCRGGGHSTWCGTMPADTCGNYIKQSVDKEGYSYFNRRTMRDFRLSTGVINRIWLHQWSEHESYLWAGYEITPCKNMTVRTHIIPCRVTESLCSLRLINHSVPAVGQAWLWGTRHRSGSRQATRVQGTLPMTLGSRAGRFPML